MQVPSLGREDPLEEGMATQSRILAWRIMGFSWDRGVWWATVHGVAKSQTRMKRLSTAQHNLQEPDASELQLSHL